ncbi:MAG: GNAT family N-acetyltransferase [Alphaproteobacteria bacterium]
MKLVLQKSYSAADSPWGVAAKRFNMVVDGAVVGTISLRLEDAPNIIGHAGHIGYGVDESHRGHGYALQACRLALSIARARGLKTVWISCNPDNEPSIRTIERLGATYVDTINLPPDNRYFDRGERQKRRYRLAL